MHTIHFYSMRFKLQVALFLLLFGFTPSAMRAATDGLRQGKLPNGLTYYIYKDAGTPGEAHFYLYQNVGAVLENDDETGLAHVLEHLAFNTTNNFPEGVMTYLRQNNLNDFEAYTGVDETRYAVHNVPTDNKGIFNKMFLLLKDWCRGIRILPKDVEKERGIVLEEWRNRENVNRRLTDSIARVVYNQSRYAHRNVIGTQTRLQTFTTKDVQRFYDKWYRPNLQYIAVIGDIDLDEVEKQIKQTLSSLPSKTAPAVGEARTINNNAQPLYMRFIDKENQTPSFGLYQRKSISPDAPAEERTKAFLFTRFFNTLAPRRFAMLKNADKEAFIAASVSYAPLVRGNYQVAFDVVPYANRQAEALQQMLSVRADLQSNGFTHAEFEAEKETMYKGMRGLLDAKGLGTPDNIMQLCKQNFLYGTPITDFREQIRQNIETLVELESTDINAWLRNLLNDENLSFVTYGRTTDEMNITADNFLSALAQSHTAKAEANTEPAPAINLAALPVTPGRIVAEKVIPTLNAKEWTLSNGARVLYKYLPKESGRFYFAGSCLGGRSAVASADIAHYTAMRNLLMQSGVGSYNRNQLAAWLQGKDFQLNLSLQDYTDGLGGNSSLADADNFFAYLHLILTQQNFSKSVFDKYIQRSKYLYTNRSTTGADAVQDSIRLMLFPPSIENPLQDTAFYNSMRHSELSRLFALHYGNAAHFTYCLAGDIPELQAKALITRYIASLKGDAAAPAPQIRPMDFASKAPQIKRTFITDVEGDRGEIEISYANSLALSEKEQAAFEVLRALLESRCFEVLREQERLTYTVGVQTSYTAQPAPSESISIHLSTARQQVDKALARVYTLLDELRNGRFSTDQFKAAVVPLAVDEQTPQSNNATESASTWMALLNVYAETGEVLNPASVHTAEPLFSTLTPADITAVARKVLTDAAHREIVMKAVAPEDKKWEH